MTSWCCHCEISWFMERIFNMLTPEQNGQHIGDSIFLKENFPILIKISQKFVPRHQIDNKSTLVESQYSCCQHWFFVNLEHWFLVNIGSCNGKPGGVSKMSTSSSTWELVILHFSTNFTSFNVWVRYLCELQRVPLKFHTKNLTHTLKDTIFYTMLKF